MKFVRYFCLLACFFLLFQAQAQVRNHTFVTDRKFFTTEDLFGYTFVPGEMEFSDSDRRSLDAGELTIYVTPQFLQVRGGNKDLEGRYNVVSIDANKYGFILKHMDARNPTVQGHLKFILDANNNVDALIFKRSRDRPEIILYQEQIDKNFAKKEAKFFTDLGEFTLEEPDSIWGTKIRPFLRISPREQDRIEAADSVYIEFIEDLVVKTKEVEEVEEVEEVVTENEPAMEDEDDPFAEGADDEDEDDSDPLSGFLKKKPKKEKAEKEPKEEEEEEVPEDDFEDFEENATFEDEMSEDRAEEIPEGKAKVKKEKVAKAPKVKEKREYKVVLRFNRWEGVGDEAVIKEERLEYPIKTWKKMTSSDPKDKDERHLLEYATKPNSILVYTDDNNAISKIVIGNVTYLMRGY